MLAIRMQRTGRKGHAQFRVVVQEARLAPSSGRVVARLGSYNPHTKQTMLDKGKTDFYLKNGARPSERVAGVLEKEGIKLPAWAKPAVKKQRDIRNPEKLRKNQPAEALADSQAEEAPKEEAEQPASEAKPETPDKEKTDDNKDAASS